MDWPANKPGAAAVEDVVDAEVDADVSWGFFSFLISVVVIVHASTDRALCSKEVESEATTNPCVALDVLFSELVGIARSGMDFLTLSSLDSNTGPALLRLPSVVLVALALFAASVLGLRTAIGIVGLGFGSLDGMVGGSLLRTKTVVALVFNVVLPGVGRSASEPSSGFVVKPCVATID